MSGRAGEGREVADLRHRFESTGDFAVGVEEEVMVLDPQSLDLTPRSDELLDRLSGDPRFKPELPASQLEIVTRPHAGLGGLVAELAGARSDLLAAAGDSLALATCGLHPFAAEVGTLRTEPRYAALADDYGIVARRQLVCALQVHVAIGGADRSLAVYNELRCHLPELLALAANAPYIAGADSGLATARPTIAIQLPRQGVPPRFDDWSEVAQELSWGRRAGAVPDVSRWWWELRPHPLHGTLELRVCDAQSSIEDAAGIVSFIQALCAHLTASHEAGEPVTRVPDWRIAENRWSAIRHGVEGTLADLRTGEPRPTRERLGELIELVAPHAERLGSAPWLHHAERLLTDGGCRRQRAAARAGGVRGLLESLREQFPPA